MPDLIVAGSQAIKTLDALGYTYHGGELWKPPIGERPKWLDYPPTIAQSIRNAAINWPQYLGDVESVILDAFFSGRDYWRGSPEVQKRTFMLFVAEALE